MFEIERKFLLTSDDFKAEAQTKTRIAQGYLCVDPERTVRVRIRGESGYFTVKGKPNDTGTSRVEVEEKIGIEKARTLMALCLPGVIEKYRYEIQAGNHTWEVDEFLGRNQGLIVAEIELSEESEFFEKPRWIGTEVTGNRTYYNSNLILHPYETWATES